MFAKQTIVLWGIAVSAVGLFSAGCSNDAQRFGTSYKKDYTVVDQGGFDMIATGEACSVSAREAAYAARKAAQFNLRSSLGDKAYIAQVQEIRRYQRGDETCVEMSAVPDPR